VEAQMRQTAEGTHPDLYAAVNHILSAGGKRVRPAVTLLTGRALHTQDQRVTKLAAAIELLHTATLVHDDLIDGALLRRGMSTLNSRWSPAATVLTGDFVFAQAAKLAAETDSVTVMKMFAETLSVLVGGEITQLFSAKGIADRKNYYNRIYAKTASMFELATGAGAVLSPYADELLIPAKKYGYAVGMAFQIVDDILDYTGKQSAVGKPVASDLRMGLITLPALYFYEENPNDPNMQAVMNGKRNDNNVIDALVADIRESGAVDAALEEAQGFIQDALDALKEYPATPERERLRDIAQYVVQRNV
jgi:geranylgeranyl pyrophosphate synthase